MEVVGNSGKLSAACWIFLALGEGRFTLEHVGRDFRHALLHGLVVNARGGFALVHDAVAGLNGKGHGFAAIIDGFGDRHDFRDFLSGEGHPVFHLRVERRFVVEIDRCVEQGRRRRDEYIQI